MTLGGVLGVLFTQLQAHVSFGGHLNKRRGHMNNNPACFFDQSLMQSYFTSLSKKSFAEVWGVRCCVNQCWAWPQSLLFLESLIPGCKTWAEGGREDWKGWELDFLQCLFVSGVGWLFARWSVSSSLWQREDNSFSNKHWFPLNSSSLSLQLPSSHHIHCFTRVLLQFRCWWREERKWVLMSWREDLAGRCAALLVVQIVQVLSAAAGTAGSFRVAGAGGSFTLV